MDASSIHYRTELRCLLDSVSHHFVQRLGEFIKIPVPSEVEYVDFEEELDPHGKTFPILVGLNVKGGGVYCDERRSFFHAVPFLLPPKLNPAASDCGVDDASGDYSDIFFPWFYECWIAAGGLRYRTSAFVGERHGFMWMELSSGEWIDRYQQ
jgi:hypothetical protein